VKSKTQDDVPTPKQKRFVEEYLIDFNGAQAAIRAGYSKKGADVQASQLLVIPKIAKAVEEGKKRLSIKSERDALWVVRQAERIYMRGTKILKSGHMRDAKAAVKSLEIIAKHLGMFVERVEHKHSGEMAQIVTYEFPDNGRKTSG